MYVHQSLESLLKVWRRSCFRKLDPYLKIHNTMKRQFLFLKKVPNFNVESKHIEDYIVYNYKKKN